MKDWIVSVVAIAVIGGLIAFAISRGIDGALMSLGVAAIAGVAGYVVPKRAKKE